MSLRETGILTTAELKEMGMFPSEERMRKGPVAIAECVEHIPCNPCETSCPFHAISSSVDMGMAIQPSAGTAPWESRDIAGILRYSMPPSPS